MKLSKVFKKVWHDIYYALAGDKAVSFALTCKETVLEADSKQGSKMSFKKIRFYLHLSLCQACKNYCNFSKMLKRQKNTVVDAAHTGEELIAFNQKLLNFLNNSKNKTN